MKASYVKLLVIAAIAFTTGAANAKNITDTFTNGTTRCVATNGSDTVYDGRSLTPTTTSSSAISDRLVGPFRTIKAAINASTSGDTIEIGEGVWGVNTESNQSWMGNTVIYFANARIRVIGRGVGKTIIQGQHDPEGENGFGTNAYRCVTIHDSTKTSGSLFEGITFRNGSTVASTFTGTDSDHKKRGGFLESCSGHCYFRDCSIENCRASSGSALGNSMNASLIRCMIRYNQGYVVNGGIIGNDVSCYNCIFTGNKSVAKSNIFENFASGYGKIVNCTIIGNYNTQIPQSGYASFYNTVICDNIGGANVIRSGNAAYYTAFDAYGATQLNCNNYNEDNFRTNMAYQIFSPLTGDYRLAPESCCINTGNPEYNSTSSSIINTWVPDEDVDKDYLKLPRLTDGKVSRGAVQTPATLPASAPALIKVGLKVDGETVTQLQADSKLWARKEGEFPTVRISAEEGDLPVFMYLNSTNVLCNTVVMRYPDLASDNGIWQTLLPSKSFAITPATSVKASKGVSMNISLYRATTNTLWVSASSTAAEPDGSEEKPFKTIQAAVNAADANARTIIKVLPGTYNEGTTAGLNGHLARVYVNEKSVFITSTEGAATTIVEGQYSSGTYKIGDDAIRCFDMNVTASKGHYSCIQGFTIRNGATDAPPSGATQWDEYAKCGGAAVQGNHSYYDINLRVQVLDSIICGNYGFSGGALWSVWAQRCKIYDNHLDKGVASGYARGKIALGSYFSSCLFYGNTGSALADIGRYSRVYNCTIDQSGNFSCNFLDDNSVVRYNTIFFRAMYGTPDSTDQLYGNVLWKGAYGKNVGFTIASAVMNYNKSDYRLANISEALTCGVDAENGQLEAFSVGTIEGEKLVANNDGSIQPGCFAETVNAKELTVTDDKTTTSEYVFENDEDGYTVSAAVARPFSGNFLVGDETRAATDRALKFTYDDETLTNGIAITAVYNPHWYVDPTKSDDNDGYTPETAKKTLAAACRIKLLYSGDTIHAAAGTYEEGAMTNSYSCVGTDEARIPSRAVVPNGVSLIGEGSSKSTIKGRYNGDVVGDSSQRGPNAMRCITLGKNCLLEGFYLCHGATHDRGSGEYNDNTGGLVETYAANISEPSTIRYCELTGGNARNGAASFGGILDHCYVHDNNSSSSGILQYIQLRHCYVVNSSANTLQGHYGVYSSTLLAKSSGGDGEYGAASGATIENSILGIADIHVASTLKNAHYCIVRTNDKLTIDSSCDNIIEINDLNKVFYSNYIIRQWDLDDSTKKGPAIDAGSYELFLQRFAADTLDYEGKQRVYNGAIDIGCYEVDWRSSYKSDLKHSNILVTNASEFVEEVAVGDIKGVRLTNGCEVAIAWPSTKGNPYLANFTLGGTGTLTVKEYGGDSIKSTNFTTAGDLSYEIESPNENTGLTFTYSGEDGDYATLLPFRGNSGLIINIR